MAVLLRRLLVFPIGDRHNCWQWTKYVFYVYELVQYFEYLCRNCNNFECNCCFSASALGQSSNQKLLVSFLDNNAFDTSLQCSGSSQTSASEIQNLRKSNSSRRGNYKTPLITNHKEPILIHVPLI